MMSNTFEVKFEFSKPRHIKYQANPLMLEEEILAVDGPHLYFYVNEGLSKDIPILDLLNELMENQVYINTRLNLFTKGGDILWTKEMNGFTISDISFSTDYRAQECLLARVTLHESAYSEVKHISNKKATI